MLVKNGAALSGTAAALHENAPDLFERAFELSGIAAELFEIAPGLLFVAAKLSGAAAGLHGKSGASLGNVFVHQAKRLSSGLETVRADSARARCGN